MSYHEWAIPSHVEGGYNKWKEIYPHWVRIAFISLVKGLHDTTVTSCRPFPETKGSGDNYFFLESRTRSFLVSRFSLIILDRLVFGLCIGVVVHVHCVVILFAVSSTILPLGVVVVSRWCSYRVSISHHSPNEQTWLSYTFTRWRWRFLM